ncbi:hypothetical protein cypCar_00033826, partial [Cyprinus carpio]
AKAGFPLRSVEAIHFSFFFFLCYYTSVYIILTCFSTNNGIRRRRALVLVPCSHQGLSARGFGEELVVLCKQGAFPKWIRRADTDRSQTNAYGATFA